jgi:hypothetical protein
MIDLSFLKTHARWLAAGLLLTFASSFGQTSSSLCSVAGCALRSS